MTTTSTRFTDRVRAALAAGAPLPSISGGDGSTEPPAVPDDLSTLSDDEVGQLHEQLQGYYNEARPNASTIEDAQALRSVVDSLGRLRTEAQTRMDEAQRLADELAALDGDANADAPEIEAPAADATVTPEPAPGTAPTPAPVTASAPAPALPALPSQAQTVPAAPAGRSRRTAPEAIRPETTITAAGDIPGFATGQTMDGLPDIARAMVAKREAIGRPGRMTGSEYVSVATLHADYPDDRHFRKGESLASIQAKLDAVTGPEALVAAGGLCAPVTPYYEIMTVAEAVRPVRDSLPTFMADRGGIRLVPPPQLSAAAGAIGFITAAVDAAALGGNAGQISAATKPCVHATCPTVTEYDVAAITRCLEFGNLTTRAYPEQVTAWLTLAASLHARKGETALIDAIATASTQVTQAKIMGAARDIVASIVKAGAYYRNHNRMSPDRPLRVMLPAFVIDMMVADLTHGSGYEAEYFTMARTEIESALGELGINVTFYLDSGTGKGQLLNSGNAQAAGAITTFPSTVVYYLFAEGSFLFLDGGTLDFGIVRDSSLNSLNNYRIFAETFETAAFVGVESLEVTVTTVADGTFAGAAYPTLAGLPASY